MGIFVLAVVTLGVTGGKKISGLFRRKVMARGESISFLEVAFKTQKKTDRILLKDFLAYNHQLRGRKSVPLPAAASPEGPLLNVLLSSQKLNPMMPMGNGNKRH